MRALLDVNVLVALFDEEHLFNELAHRWLETGGSQGWASSSMTENGLVRVLCHPNYSKKARFSPFQVVTALRHFVAHGSHEFWPDDLTLRDSAVFNPAAILGPRQITDLYLLGLAVRHGGRLVTFDEGINLSAVVGATPAHLLVLRSR